MGPNSRGLLSALTDADLSNDAFPFGSSRVVDLGYARVRASRITYVGELGWELYIGSEFAQSVYDELVRVGAGPWIDSRRLPRDEFVAYGESVPALGA